MNNIELEYKDNRSEDEIVDHIIKNIQKIIGKHNSVKKEVPIYGCVTRSIIGYADIVIDKAGKKYICEAKKKGEGLQFLWESMKVLAYAKSQSLYDGKKAYPVVIVHRNVLKYDLLPVLYHLDIGYIAYDDCLEYDVHLINN